MQRFFKAAFDGILRVVTGSTAPWHLQMARLQTWNMLKYVKQIYPCIIWLEDFLMTAVFWYFDTTYCVTWLYIYKHVLWNTSSLCLPHSPKVLTNPHITFKQKEPRNPAKVAGNVVVIPAITACISFNNTCLVLVLVLVTVVLAVLLPINSIQPPAPAPPPQSGRRGNKQAHSHGWRGLLENAHRTHICIWQEQRSWVSLAISTITSFSWMTCMNISIPIFTHELSVLTFSYKVRQKRLLTAMACSFSNACWNMLFARYLLVLSQIDEGKINTSIVD